MCQLIDSSKFKSSVKSLNDPDVNLLHIILGYNPLIESGWENVLKYVNYTM